MPHCFQLKTTDGKARRGSLQLAHGVVETPIFMPVATTGAIKGLLPEDLLSMDAQIILANTYHMLLRPGVEIVGDHGGLHNFMAWDRPILTDSGGFQIWSLNKLNKLTEEGAHFRSHLDGAKFTLTPEEATRLQEVFGSDIHMVLDECTDHPCSKDQAQESMRRSMRWAQRSRDARTREELCQFGIAQGGVFADLRKESCEHLQEIGFEGYAIGGLSVGEEKPAMREMTDLCTGYLPESRPRYLMGVGTPLDLVESVGLGVDMFDCVMPARNARRGTLFTSHGRINIKNEQYKASQEPLDSDCKCYTCQTYTRSFLRHMFGQNPITSHRLLSLHNLTFYLKLMADVRDAIEAGVFSELLRFHRSLWDK